MAIDLRIAKSIEISPSVDIYSSEAIEILLFGNVRTQKSEQIVV